MSHMLREENVWTSRTHVDVVLTEAGFVGLMTIVAGAARTVRTLDGVGDRDRGAAVAPHTARYNQNIQ